MRAQVAERDGRLGDGDAGRRREHRRGAGRAAASPAAELRCAAAVAVVSGEGLRELFDELGVHTIDGGPTLNPSTYDLLAGIHEVPAEEVVLLTNSAERDHGRRARRAAVGQAGARRAHHQPAGRPRRGGRARAGPLGRGERAGAQRGARAGAHRRRRAGRARRRPGALPARRRRRLRARTRCSPGASRARRSQAVLRALATARRRRGPARADQRARRARRRRSALGEIEGMVNGGVELELRHGGQPAYWWLLAAE